MPKKDLTPSYTTELDLVVNKQQAKQLEQICDISRKLYNAVLGESLRRLKVMHQAKDWKIALAMPKRTKERTEKFKSLREKFGYTINDLEKFGKECKNGAKWNKILGSHPAQVIIQRAFNAVENYGYGKKGKPRFKSSKRAVKSICGKNNQANLVWNSKTEIVSINKLRLKVKMPTIQQDEYLLESLINRTKYCRIVWRNVKSQKRWYIQLVQEGFAPSKSKNYTIKGEAVGLDVGPSNIAAVAVNKDPNLVYALFQKFCSEIDHPYQKIRNIQRMMDRSKRATNPKCYNHDKTTKKGSKFIYSGRYIKTRSQYQELERKLSATRKSAHGKLANDILRNGNIIKTEQISYKSFQKNYGKSVKVRAPSMFMQILKYKAEKAGGEFIELNTWKLKMSQYDHKTQEYTKKKLSDRWHNLGAGDLRINRDIYSAFLAYCIENNDQIIHNPSKLETEWTSLEPVLRQMGLCINQVARPSSERNEACPRTSE